MEAQKLVEQVAFNQRIIVMSFVYSSATIEYRRVVSVLNGRLGAED